MNQILKLCHALAPRSPELEHQVSFHNPTEEALASIAISPNQIRYDERNILGSGSFAEVFRGTYRQNGKTTVVAVKRLKVDAFDLLHGLSDVELARDAKELATEAWSAYRCGP
jgi:hypothetical protein